jgi:hypothetical protein
MSAFRISASRFFVFEWHMVTVASAFRSRAAMGLPTSMLRPTTTARCPSVGILYSSRIVMIPCGVQGAKTGVPASSLPRL